MSGVAPSVQVITSSDACAPGIDGYLACVGGFAGRGEGRSGHEAVADLEVQLQEYVLEWDAEADTYKSARAPLDVVNQHEEPPLVTWARDELHNGTLLEELRRIAALAAICDPGGCGGGF
jgi:hypothetical protein